MRFSCKYKEKETLKIFKIEQFFEMLVDIKKFRTLVLTVFPKTIFFWETIELFSENWTIITDADSEVQVLCRFCSPQGKHYLISSIKDISWEWQQNLPNNVRLRVLGNEETLGKSQGYLINYVMTFEIRKKN